MFLHQLLTDDLLIIIGYIFRYAQKKRGPDCCRSTLSRPSHCPNIIRTDNAKPTPI